MKRWMWWLIAGVIAATLAAERLVHHEYDYWFTSIPGFFVMLGFVGCVAIILVSKWFGKAIVERDEDYYQRRGDDDPHRAMSDSVPAGRPVGTLAPAVPLVWPPDSPHSGRSPDTEEDE